MGRNAACGHLLHREEGIDLRLPHSRKDIRVLVEECRYTSVSEANRIAVGSISMKIWS